MKHMRKLPVVLIIAAIAATAVGGTFREADAVDRPPVDEIGYSGGAETLRSSPLDTKAIRKEASLLAIATVVAISEPFVLDPLEKPANPIMGNRVTYEVNEALSPFKDKTFELVVPGELVTARVGTSYAVAAAAGPFFLEKDVLRPIWVGELVDGAYADRDHLLELEPQALAPVGSSLDAPVTTHTAK